MELYNLFPFFLFRLTDFGTSKILQSKDGNMTKIVGTPLYMVNKIGNSFHFHFHFPIFLHRPLKSSAPTTMGRNLTSTALGLPSLSFGQARNHSLSLTSNSTVNIHFIFNSILLFNFIFYPAFIGKIESGELVNIKYQHSLISLFISFHFPLDFDLRTWPLRYSLPA